MNESILFSWYLVIVGVGGLIHLLYHSIYPTEKDLRAIAIYRLEHGQSYTPEQP